MDYKFKDRNDYNLQSNENREEDIVNRADRDYNRYIPKDISTARKESFSFSDSFVNLSKRLAYT